MQRLCRHQEYLITTDAECYTETEVATTNSIYFDMMSIHVHNVTIHEVNPRNPIAKHEIYSFNGRICISLECDTY